MTLLDASSNLAISTIKNTTMNDFKEIEVQEEADMMWKAFSALSILIVLCIVVSAYLYLAGYFDELFVLVLVGIFAKTIDHYLKKCAS